MEDHRTLVRRFNCALGIGCKDLSNFVQQIQVSTYRYSIIVNDGNQSLI